ncbi:bifunctional 4-hydroxy-2-oxoglutarate aldolase/2-dehydro-3-deoxy-phosphogluconate aldolase [Vallitalea sediminicola]
MNLLKQVKENKIITILRNIPIDQILPIAQALYDGGIKLLEITFDQSSSTGLSDTSMAISMLADAMGDKMYIGAGTVMTSEQLNIAYKAGAKYILTPNLDEKIIYESKKLGLNAISGAFTPSEIVTAYNAGSDIVKLFPAGSIGTEYIKAIRAPINHIPIIAVGGVNEINILKFLDSGIVGAGIGSNIVKNNLVKNKNYEGITKLAKKYIRAVKMK